MRVIVLCLSTIYFSLSVHASENDKRTEDSTYALTATSLRSSVLYFSSDQNASLPRAAAKRSRSIPLAFGASAVVPGLGQIYNRQWVKAALAVLVEGAVAAGYVYWRNEGMDGEKAYQAYAHSFWDPSLYASWLNQYTAYLNESYSAGITPPGLSAPTGINFKEPSVWTDAERQIVRQFFSEMRAIEDELFHPSTDASFSHNLPYFGEQQYYELIGKYFQFAPGWEDYPLWHGNEEALDPEATDGQGNKIYVQGRFWQYADDHGEANDLLRRASRLTAVIIVNHLVAAIDAAVSTKLHNDRLQTEFAARLDPVTGFPQPSFALRLGL